MSFGFREYGFLQVCTFPYSGNKQWITDSIHWSNQSWTGISTEWSEQVLSRRHGLWVYFGDHVELPKVNTHPIRSTFFLTMMMGDA